MEALHVTGDQGDEETKGLKNEMVFGGIYAFGDDVNFALGDGLETIADGLFISAKNATGWESDGVYVGNYTDIWPGLGFNYDKLNVTLRRRFYSPGSYAKLPDAPTGAVKSSSNTPSAKTLWCSLTGNRSTAPKWMGSFQHHVGTGVSFSF